MEDSSDIGWFQAPGNLGFAVLGLLYGEGDFGRSVALAVNCGDDTDCTAGTVGAILGIINGRSGIPEKWCAPIGDGIRTCSIENVGRTCLLNVPATLTELTDRVVCCAELAAFEDPELLAFSDRAGRIQHLQSVWRHFYRVSRRCFSRNLTGHANSIPPFGRADMAPLCDCRGCHRKSTRLRLADSVFSFLNYSERSYLYESKAKRPGI